MSRLSPSLQRSNITPAAMINAMLAPPTAGIAVAIAPDEPWALVVALVVGVAVDAPVVVVAAALDVEVEVVDAEVE